MTRDTDNDDIIELQDLLKLFKKPDETISEEELDKKELKSKHDDCFMYLLTKAEKLQCLEKNQRYKKTVGRESFYYPDYYHKFYTQRPKRTIYSLYNYYGGLLKSKPFTDLTRQEFSQDYLDVGELSRKERCNYPECVEDIPLWKQNYKRKLRGIPRGVSSVRRNNKGSKPVFVEEIVRDDSSDSSDDDRTNDRHGRRHKKRNRFQVVFNGDSSAESEERQIKPHKSLSSESEEYVKKAELSSSESVEVTQKPTKIRDKYEYLQGHKLYDSYRRRLQHFLPKRFHWDADDIQHLGYYWFDGPRGKYS